MTPRAGCAESVIPLNGEQVVKSYDVIKLVTGFLIYGIVFVYQTYTYGFCISVKPLNRLANLCLIFDILDEMGVEPGSGK